MKKTSCFIIGSLLFVSTFAQNEDQQHKVIDRSDGSMQYFYTLTEVDGNPFLKDNWTKAYALTADGYRFPKMDVKFDVYNGKFIFNKNDTAFEFPDQVTIVQVLPNENDTSNKQVFERGFAISNSLNKNKFVQVLAEGKTSLLKAYKKEIEDYDVYGDAKKHQRYKATEQYYVLMNGQYVSAKLTKKDLESIFSSKATDIDAFLQKNNLSGKDEKSWIAAINYFNTL